MNEQAIEALIQAQSNESARDLVTYAVIEGLLKAGLTGAQKTAIEAALEHAYAVHMASRNPLFHAAFEAFHREVNQWLATPPKAEP